MSPAPAAARALMRRRRHDAGDQVGLRPRPRQRDEVAAGRAPPGRELPLSRRHDLPRRARRCRPRPTATRTPTSPTSATPDACRRAKAAWPTRSTRSARGIAFSPEQTARVFEAAQAVRPAGEAACRAALRPRRRRARRRASAPCRPIISNMPTRPASQAMAQAGTVAVLLPGAFYFLRETQKPPVELLRKHGVPIAIATDCNPGTSPLTSLLLTMNMAATLFRLTVDECLAGVTREAAQRAGPARRGRHARSRQVVRPRDLGHRAPGRAGLPHRLQSAASRASGGANDQPRARRCPCATGAPSIAARVPRSIRPALPRDRGRRAAVAAIVAKGEPVYGINTGFGKLASVRIAPADLATLQRNIVLSHAAGVGAPMPVPVARLMMALKLASLAQGASGVRPETVRLLEAMLAKRPDAGRALPGLGRRLGRSRAARPHGGGDDRRRRDHRRRPDRARRRGAGRCRPDAADARRRRKASRC